MQSHDLAFRRNVYVLSLMSCMSCMGVCLHVYYAAGGLFVKEDDLTEFINRSDVSYNYPRSILVRYPTRDLRKGYKLAKARSLNLHSI